jgi:glycine/D-amino acid oxidase-like deaminating enzyme
MPASSPGREGVTNPDQRKWRLKNSRATAEHTGAILATGFWSSARMFADLHPERSGRLVEIGPIEERVRQTINQAKRRLVSPGLQRFVQQDRSSRRSTPSRVA